jgi:hypothetical protein
MLHFGSDVSKVVPHNVNLAILKALPGLFPTVLLFSGSVKQSKSHPLDGSSDG